MPKRRSICAGAGRRISHKGHIDHIERRFGFGDFAAKNAKFAKYGFEDVGLSLAKALRRKVFKKKS
jgi:hypothetical protein